MCCSPQLWDWEAVPNAKSPFRCSSGMLCNQNTRTIAWSWVWLPTCRLCQSSQHSPQHRTVSLTHPLGATYTWPVSWATTKVEEKPSSRSRVQLLRGWHMPAVGAYPARENEREQVRWSWLAQCWGKRPTKLHPQPSTPGPSRFTGKAWQPPSQLMAFPASP